MRRWKTQCSELFAVAGFATFCNVQASVTSVTELQPANSPDEILNLLRKSLKRTMYLAERCVCEFMNFNSEVHFHQ